MPSIFIASAIPAGVEMMESACSMCRCIPPSTTIPFELPVTDIRQRNQALTGNLDWYNAGSRSSFRLGFSSGFRAPNVDDLSKLFESSTADRQGSGAQSGYPGPEYTASFDLGYLYRFQQGLKSKPVCFIPVSPMPPKAPFQLNGQDSIDYNGVFAGAQPERETRPMCSARIFSCAGGSVNTGRPRLR